MEASASIRTGLNGEKNSSDRMWDGIFFGAQLQEEVVDPFQLLRIS